MSAARMVWDLAGRPRPTGAAAGLLQPVEAPCGLCGNIEAATAPSDKALGKNWTDRAHLARPDSPRVCTGCLWVCSGRPPHSLRMWTVIAAPNAPASHEKCRVPSGPGLAFINRSNPGPVADLLANPPDSEWVLSVAVSGQKHVLPYARVNRGRAWTVRMETTDITATTDQWARVHAAAVGLRRLGVPADAIPAREPRFIKTRAQLAQWADLDCQLMGWHQSPLLQLALWCITKGTLNANT